MTAADAVRVSIITPFLNPGPFLHEAVASVLAQTYPHWELLLVDDGSTDGSPAIARAYAEAHPDRIRCLAHEGRAHRGASASRNLGAAMARGEYVAFLDADDVYLPHKLAEQVPLLDARPDVGMLYGGSEYWHSWTGRPEDASRDWVWRKYGVTPDTTVAPPRLLATFLRDGGTVPCMGSVLARRSAIEQAGGWEDAFHDMCDDQVFHAKMALRFPIFVASGCWDRYRQHEASTCHTVARAGRQGQTFLVYLSWLEAYLAQRQVSDAALWAALRGAVRQYRRPWLHRLERHADRHLAWVRRTLAGRR